MTTVDCIVAPIPKYPLSMKSPPLSPRLTRESPKLLSSALVSTPPASPPTTCTSPGFTASLLHPPDAYKLIALDVRAITARELSLAMRKMSEQPLPSSTEVFPWLHGCSPEPDVFVSPRRAGPPMPLNAPMPTTYRGIALVHKTSPTGQGGRLVNSIESRELIGIGPYTHFFLERGFRYFNIRNFGLQTQTLARLSDIVVYAIEDSEDALSAALELASEIAEAQRALREEYSDQIPVYNTFLLTDSFESLERDYPELVERRTDGRQMKPAATFKRLEREEMRRFTRATEIFPNVFMGNTEDWTSSSTYTTTAVAAEKSFCIHIQCKDEVDIPLLPENAQLFEDPHDVLEFSFPSPNNLQEISNMHIQAIVRVCAWIYRQTHTTVSNEPTTSTQLKDAQLDVIHDPMDITILQKHLTTEDETFSETEGAKKVLISCDDGYSESTLLGLAYTMYANCMNLHEAWVHLHGECKRDFYLCPEVMKVLRHLAHALIEASPCSLAVRSAALDRNPQRWHRDDANAADQMHGNIPNRIKDYLYLGNLDHANDIVTLQDLGITRVLSVGECPDWRTPTSCRLASPVSSLHIPVIGDDGIDSLTPHIDKCLEFIDEGFRSGEKTLVHCKVGVSRSASICIAEFIRRDGMSITQAYLCTRARRLNLIIQPNLRLMYELLCWSQEEHTQQRRKSSPENMADDTTLVARSIEWPNLAQNIAELNRLYLQPQFL